MFVQISFPDQRKAAHLVIVSSSMPMLYVVYIHDNKQCASVDGHYNIKRRVQKASHSLARTTSKVYGVLNATRLPFAFIEQRTTKTMPPLFLWLCCGFSGVLTGTGGASITIGSISSEAKTSEQPVLCLTLLICGIRNQCRNK